MNISSRIPVVFIFVMSILDQKVSGQMTGLSAIVSGGGTVCLNASSPNIVFTGAQGQIPYTFYYTINGSMMSFVATTQGNDSTLTIPAPTNNAGNFIYSLQQVMDGAGNTQMLSGSVSVNVLSKLTSSIQVSLCPGSLPFTWHGVSYSSPGTYTFDTTSSSGCDSLITLALSLYPVSSTTTIAIDSTQLPYKWNKKNYTSAGVYTYSSKTVAGCDSTATLHLIVISNPPPPDYHYALNAPLVKGISIGTLTPQADPPGTISDFLNDIHYQTSSPEFLALTVDALRNVYLFDSYNAVIDKVDTGGNVTVLQPLPYLSASSAVIDPQGNLYFANAGDLTLRKLPPNGTTAIVVNAGLSAPSLVAIDPAANVYVTDNSFNTVTRISPNGNHAVIWTNTQAITAFGVDSAGNIILADASGLCKISPAGTKLQVYSAFTGDAITGIALDRKGNIYVGDVRGVSRIAALDGSVSAVGSGISSPGGMALDYFGNLYVCDGNNYYASVKKISGVNAPAISYSIVPALPAGITLDPHTGILTGTPIIEVPSTDFHVAASNGGGSSKSIFTLTVTDAAVDSISYNSPNIYAQNKTIDSLSPVYAVGTITSTTVDTFANTDLIFAAAVASDKQNNIYAAQFSVHGTTSAIEKFSPDGKTTSTIQTEPLKPDALAVDAQGNIFFVTNGVTNTITVIMPSGNRRSFSFPTPQGLPIISLATDSAGNLYAGEATNLSLPPNSNNYTLWKVAAGDSVATPFAHVPADGLAADQHGLIYVAPETQKILYRIAPDGTTTALALNYRIASAICVNATGNVLVMDLDHGAMHLVNAAFTNADGIYLYSLGSNAMTGSMCSNSEGDVFFPAYSGNPILRIFNPKRFVVTNFAIAPSLPMGLKIDSASGTISGRPLFGSPATSFTVTANRLAGNVLLPVSIAVNVVDTIRKAVCSASLPYMWKGAGYNSAGTYSKLVPGTGGPDTASTLILSINPSPSVNPKNGAYMDSVCYGATHTVALSASGGKKPYQYSTDGIGWQSVASFSLSAGIYSLKVEDANGCIGSTSPITIIPPPAKLAIDSLKISQGILTVDASGGFNPYQYSFDGGDLQSVDQFNLKLTGKDTVLVEDAAGCTITKAIGLMTATAMVAGNSDTVCYGGKDKIQTTVSGGVKPYQYSLDNINWQSSASFSVIAGSYTVMVKDANNNLATTNSITIFQPQSPLSLSLAIVNPTCKSAVNGSITANATGGFGNYMYSIDKVNFQNSALFSGLPAGTYSITAADAFGCTTIQPATLKKSTQACAQAASVSDTGFGRSLPEDSSPNPSLSISPNPSHSVFHLTVSEAGPSTRITVIIRDILGRERQIMSGQTSTSFDFGADLDSGIYLVEIISSTGRSILKVIKIK